MLHVTHDAENGRLLVRFEGSLDDHGADSLLSALALTPVTVPVVLDLGGTTSISNCALARLSQVLGTRDTRFRNLRLRHRRLVESVRFRSAVGGKVAPPPLPATVSGQS